LIGLAAISGNWTLNRDGILAQTFTYPFLALLFAAMLVITLKGPEGTGLAARWFSHPVMRFFGRYSYGIYVFNSLLNPPFVEWLPPRRIALLTHSLELGAVVHVVLEFVVTIGLAMLSYHLYEMRFLRLKDILAPDKTRQIGLDHSICFGRQRTSPSRRIRAPNGRSQCRPAR
jgi:peptidoglycan/LPS O-acetylase OafA/YrhL